MAEKKNTVSKRLDSNRIKLCNQEEQGYYNILGILKNKTTD